MNTLLQTAAEPRSLRSISERNGNRIYLYRSSLRIHADALYCIGRESSGKYLYIITSGEAGRKSAYPEGTMVPGEQLATGLQWMRCPMNHETIEHLRSVFPFLRPVTLGLDDSFGFGDRLGIANPAHIRSLAGSHMRPILAQQSIRELDRTQRTAMDVLDAASWAAFQEGFTAGFGADADHLKTAEDIDRYAEAGFTFYTFDPSAHVVNDAVRLSIAELRARIPSMEAGDMTLAQVLQRYAGKSYRMDDGSSLEPTEEQIIRAFVKYGAVIRHAASLYRHLRGKHASLRTEVELSVDETDIPTTPIEHLFIAGELKRLGVEWVSLAPRFIGDFEKGVDYRGDLEDFRKEYIRHLSIARILGPYKISIHSGSDKFGVYKVIGSIRSAAVHVKTAGTSWLEALRTIATADPDLMRSILEFAKSQYEEARKSYLVTGRLECIPSGSELTDERLPRLFNEHDARQVLHVTFGQVLTKASPDGAPLFKNRIMACLDANEDLHYQTLITHFRKHLDPFRRV